MSNKTGYICKMTVSNGKQTYRAGDRISLDPDAAKQLLAARAIEVAVDQVVSGGDTGEDLSNLLKTVQMLEDAGKALQAQIDKLTEEKKELVASNGALQAEISVLKAGKKGSGK